MHGVASGLLRFRLDLMVLDERFLLYVTIILTGHKGFLRLVRRFGLGAGNGALKLTSDPLTSFDGAVLVDLCSEAMLSVVLKPTVVLSVLLHVHHLAFSTHAIILKLSSV